MSEFENVVCWNTESVLAAAPRDAAALGDGHFQAVHHPLRVRKRRIEERAGGNWVEEADVAEALRGPLRADGYLFIPIIGGSGTGKSHLVRWVQGQTEGTPGWEVRYLPKNRTGIRQALDIVTRGLTGEKIAEAREALEAAPATYESETVLATRLVNELAILIADRDNFPEIDPYRQQLRDKLAKELPGTLTDPVVRKKLEAAGAVIPRLVGLTLRGRQDQDGLDDDATRVSAKDLPLTFNEISQASQGAQKLLGQLKAIPDLLDATVDLINAALPRAEKKVSISEQVDLVEVFRDVRRTLLAEGKELVLFIEDLTVLHGVEREFLDAIVEPSRSDEGDMCNLRVIFAMTEHRFDELDTVRTRCDDAYWLDAPYGDGGVGPEEAVSFLGRYYNASRLPAESIERAWTARHGEHWLPNACADCAHQETCHATFGATSEGYGLYPLNQAATGRLVDAISTKHLDARTNRFDPRQVVRELVERLLRLSAVHLRQKTFPADAIFTPFQESVEPLPPVILDALQDRVPAGYKKAGSILRYWSPPGALADTSEGVLSAFGLDAAQVDLESLAKLGGSARRPVSAPTKGAEPKPGNIASTDVPVRLRGGWQGCYEELTHWVGQSQDLSMRATRELRNLVHKTVRNNLELGSTPTHLSQLFDSRRFNAERLIGFEGTVTHQNFDSVLIKFERTNENAFALQALILASEADLADLPEAARYRRKLAAAVEGWTDRVRESLLLPPDATVVSAVERLLVVATVLGLASDAKSPVDYLDAIFAPLPERMLGSLERSKAWVDLAATARDRIGPLRDEVQAQFGESRGTRGGVRILQAHRLLPLVERFVAKWSFTGSDSDTGPLMRSVEAAVMAEWKTLQQRVDEADEHLDRDHSWRDQTDKVLAVLKVAVGAGRLPDLTAIEDLIGLAGAGSGQLLRSFAEAAKAVAANPPTPEKLSLLSSGVPDDVANVHAFVTRAALALAGIEHDLDLRQAASGVSDTEAIVNRVTEALGRFSETAKELAG